MKKTRLAVIGLVVVLFSVSSVYAQAQSVDKPDGSKFKEGIYKLLDLTSEQQKKLEENRLVQREKISQLRATMMEKEKQLRQSLKDSDVTRGQVEPLVNEIKSLQAQLIDQRINGIFAVKAILTVEQASKLNQLMEMHKEGKKGRFQKLQKRFKDYKMAQDNK